jgi:hypothetical protein
LNEYSSPGSANYDYRLKTASYAKKAGLWLCDIGALQRQENTYPAAAKVYGGPGEGTFGDVLQPTTPTLRASNLHSGAGAPGVDLAADILADTATVDDVIGTCAVPGQTHVRRDIPVGGGTGSLDVPDYEHVRYGVSVDGGAGTCHVPGASDVLKDVPVDVSPTVGTFDEAARNTDPGVANVKDGTAYKIHGSDYEGEYVTAGGGSPVFGGMAQRRA